MDLLGFTEDLLEWGRSRKHSGLWAGKSCKSFLIRFTDHHPFLGYDKREWVLCPLLWIFLTPKHFPDFMQHAIDNLYPCRAKQPMAVSNRAWQMFCACHGLMTKF